MKGIHLFIIVSIVLVCFGCSRGGAINTAGGSLSHGNQVVSRNVADVIAEAENFSAPVGSDVDPDVFEQLRTELILQLEERYGDTSRIAANAPAGDAGRVTDLAYGTDTGELSWSYINLGDYDANGEVGIPDITPIAQNYLAVANDGIGNDAYESWIDGDKSGEVGISDIIPIAQGYLNNVAGYQIVTCDTTDGSFSAIGDPVTVTYITGYPAHINTPLPAGALEYVAVEPLDSAGNAGERSVSVQISTGVNPPLITDVSPKSGATGTQVQFEAEVEGTEPFSCEWNFNGGAIPDISVESTPTVTLGTVNTYNASLTVTNSAGSDTFEFTLTVTNEVIPPEIISVNPVSGITGTSHTFEITTNGTTPLTYAWNFGGGANPNISTDKSPTVELASSGGYLASVTVTNSQGSDLFNFLIRVTDISIYPLIVNVTPTSGMTGSEIQFRANVVDTPSTIYMWDFGGGASPNSSQEVAPVVTLGNKGDYSASLYVVNDLGYEWFRFTLRVTDQVYLPEVVNISHLSSFHGDYTQFSALVKGTPPFTYFWQFNIGASPAYSKDESPIVQLGDSGTYPASVRISNAKGTVTYNFFNYVDYRNSYVYCYPRAVESGSTVEFTAVPNMDGEINYEWDFGGGATPNISKEEAPVVTAGDAGSYDASLKVSCAYGSASYEYILTVFDVDWQNETVDEQYGSGWYPDMAIDKNDNIHISYANSEDSSLRYAKWNGDKWSVEEIEGTEVDYSNPASLALDTNGYPNIAFFDYNYWDLVYAKWDGLTWILQEVLDTTDHSIGRILIALNSGDYPCILYGDRDDLLLKYATWNGTEWTFDTPDTVNEDLYPCSLVLDSLGYPHICYECYDGYDSYLNDILYAYWDGTTWVIKSVESGGLFSCVTLALDSFDNPHIVYNEGDYFNLLKYVTWDGSNWNTEIIDDESNLFNASLVLDSNNKVHIAGIDNHGSFLRYAHKNGMNWEIDFVDGNSYVDDVSIALDSKDTPHIAYTDWNTGTLKHAWPK